MHPDDQLSVHQALHGYDDGHRLIAASRDLPAAAQRTVLLLSDWSGSGRVSGFDAYITGYPLPHANAYAFAKTWYAHEMKRPGCVWTHTLLIQFSDVAKLRNLRHVLSFFRRPQGPIDTSDYSTPLKVPYGADDERPVTTPHTVLFALLGGLYEQSDRAVFLLAPSADEYLDLTLSIWGQQWPRLRRAFSFCTGAMSSRSLQGKQLDLQTIPLARSKHVRRSEEAGIFISPAEDRETSVQVPTLADETDRDWIGEVAQDLRRGTTQTTLRQELSWFGADVPASRTSFPRLVNVILHARMMAREEYEPFSLVSEVARAFPEPSSAARLKTELFGGPLPHTRRWPAAPEQGVLFCMLTTQDHAAFDYEQLQVHPRATSLWNRDRAAGRALLVRLLEAKCNPEGARVLDRLLTSITVQDLVVLPSSKLRPQFLHRVLRENPQLLQTSAFWRLPEDSIREVVEAVLQDLGASAFNWYLVARAIVEARATVGSDVVLEKIEPARFVQVMLDALQEGAFHSWNDMPGRWVAAMRRQPMPILDWIVSHDPPANVTAQALLLLNPQDTRLRSPKLSLWLNLAERAEAEPMSSPKLDIMTFLLTLALWHLKEGGDRIIQHTFQPVHDTLEHRQFGGQAARWLLPRLHERRSLFSPRDPAELLRRTVLDTFTERGWPVVSLRRAVRSPVTLTKMTQYCMRRYGEHCILHAQQEMDS